MPIPRFLASELPDLPPERCLFHVLPVPYEATVSYGGGTAQGPEAIVQASQQLEVWTGECNPGEQGIYTWPAVSCAGSAPDVLDAIQTAVTAILDVPFPGGALPVVLGGEHSVTLGVLQALQARFGHFGVVQFDAHADLRDTYGGTPYSHACVMRRAVADLGLDLFQIGVRSLSPPEVAYRKEQSISHLDARTLAAMKAAGTALPQDANRAGSLLPPAFPERLFLTFDIDALDAALMPATGTPEPGGLGWWEALALVRGALAGRTLLGLDCTEFAPLSELEAPTFTAARLVYELMGEALLARNLKV